MKTALVVNVEYVVQNMETMFRQVNINVMGGCVQAVLLQKCKAAADNMSSKRGVKKLWYLKTTLPHPPTSSTKLNCLNKQNMSVKLIKCGYQLWKFWQYWKY
jgi:hypothetical protein